MKQLVIFFFFTAFSFTASAQFPLGSDANTIKAYFDKNIPYLSAQDFKTVDGTNAVCYRKFKEIGDYSFYFDGKGQCFTYTVTYDKNELRDLEKRFDFKFVRIYPTRWTAQDNSFDVTLVPPKPGDNFFSIIYKPLDSGKGNTNTLTSK